MKTAILKLNNINKKKIFISLVFSIAFLFSFYIYLIIQTTVNITTYQYIQQEIINLDSSIGDLEFKYMSEIQSKDRSK